ncbi:DUF1415 domain-containing protein [Ramlibacter henchirensis]|uniref:DUF1415 domain-containing protein n=1 Tax=Ramlibacter henchirensis TaxID=204072 RepID=A0A4Z0C8U2_9BURK|nr:DUF1415 domain-containing protein [Ramlibacter henchirensis]TFZ07312.1 DUF1415 domain-containing protein [Ramlibacter henchirensis]
MADAPFSSAQAIADTRRWLERAVIGLNLCPFAKAVHVRGQVHFAVSASDDVPGVIESLDAEITDLLALEPAVRDTTLLVVPNGFDEFLLFHDLVRQGERLLARRKLAGVLQLASFHPAFVFAGANEDDMANFSNRAPWPTLHLLREESMDRAVAAFPDAELIYEANIRTLERLGREGWLALGARRS